MRDVRKAALGLVLAGAVGARALLASGTSGAFTAKVTNSNDHAKAAATFKCADVFAAPRAKGTPNTGMTLYVDGALSNSNAAFTTAESNTGWWRIGYDTLGSGWTGNTATSGVFVGSMKYAAAYRYVLTAAEIKSMYTIGAPA